jgi:uncharacterized membrane protein
VLLLVHEVVRFALAIWVGGTLVLVLAAPALFRLLPSRDQAGAVFDEILRKFEVVKQLLSLLLVLCVFAELEARGGAPRGALVPGIAMFLAIASNVYLAMVLRPRMKYFRMKVGSFDTAAADNPWRARFDRLHRRSIRVLTLGWLAAAVALALYQF